MNPAPAETPNMVPPKVLVTGASGFLGGWVVECFDLNGWPVRAGIRSWNSAVRLARRELDIVPCDILSIPQLRAALQDCSAVVHCAVGNERVTVEGTRNVMTVAADLKIARVVHLSSVAVYGAAVGNVTEKTPRTPSGNWYAKSKVAAEEICEDFIRRGVPISMLRPSIVYGPFSYTWTTSFATRIASGRWGTLGKAGDGTCNLVYVTDVVQAIVRALHAPAAIGETFNVNGGDSLTWNEYFVRMNQALGYPPLRSLKPWRMAVKSRLLTPVRAAGRLALGRFRSAIMKLHAKSPLAAQTMRLTESSLKLTPTPDQLKLFGQRVEYSIDKAKQTLGYAPQVDVAQGVDFSVAWLRQQGWMG
jgi:nucleoside-diphosphate-sugar epimerase